MGEMRRAIARRHKRSAELKTIRVHAGDRGFDHCRRQARTRGHQYTESAALEHGL